MAGFLRTRVDPSDFRGLPLTVILIGGGVMVVLFSEIAEEVLEEEELLLFDQRILDALQPLRVAPFVQVFAWITHFGDNATLAGTVLVGLGFLWAFGRRDLLLGVAVTVLGSQIMLWVSKFGFDRQRPEFITEVTAASPSFPSGHTTGAMAIFGILAYAMARICTDPGRRLEIGFWAGLLIAAVGFSRVYLHVHYPSDVVAGVLTGGVWLLAGIAVAEWTRRHEDSARATSWR